MYFFETVLRFSEENISIIWKVFEFQYLGAMEYGNTAVIFQMPPINLLSDAYQRIARSNARVVNGRCLPITRRGFIEEKVAASSEHRRRNVHVIEGFEKLP